MAKAIPNPGLTAHGNLGRQLLQKRMDGSSGRADEPSAGLETPPDGASIWANEPAMPAGLDNPLADPSPFQPGLGDALGELNPLAQPAGWEQLQAENQQLHGAIAQLRDALEAAARQAPPPGWQERQKEYESLLEEKSELIRTLHLKIQELEAAPRVPQTPKEEELVTMSEELERERCQFQQEQRELEDLRRRLSEDEQDMLRQMREMEVQMARERADYARRRTELQRIFDEIRRELENVERNGMLNQRLNQLRQRSQDMANFRGSPGSAPDPDMMLAQSQEPGASYASQEDNGKDGNLLRRLFGKG
jgi:hypothetical protein